VYDDGTHALSRIPEMDLSVIFMQIGNQLNVTKVIYPEADGGGDSAWGSGAVVICLFRRTSERKHLFR